MHIIFPRYIHLILSVMDTIYLSTMSFSLVCRFCFMLTSGFPTNDIGQEWQCMFAEHAAEHIQTPVFALQSEYVTRNSRLPPQLIAQLRCSGTKNVKFVLLCMCRRFLGMKPNLDQCQDSWQQGHVQGPGGSKKTQEMGKNITERSLVGEWELPVYLCSSGYVRMKHHLRMWSWPSPLFFGVIKLPLSRIVYKKP